MSVAITPVSAGAPQAGAAAQTPQDVSSGAALRGSDTQVTFNPNPSAAGPLGKLSEAGVSAIRGFESRANDYQTATAQMTGQGGPASAYDAAKQSLMAGPASLRVGEAAVAGPASPSQSGANAVEAMRLSFDYAVETQLVVKTGTQFSNAANSLLRGQ